MPIIVLLIIFIRSLFKSECQLALENLALRQQVAMLRRSVKRPRVSTADRLFWILFSRHVDGWRKILHALHPDTVVRWHRRGFRLYWRWKSRGAKPGRPAVKVALRELIRQMQASNIGWGAPRIHGELRKLGIEVSQSTVSKYMQHPKKPPSQTWRTFLNNHAHCLVAMDFFTLPTPGLSRRQNLGILLSCGVLEDFIIFTQGLRRRSYSSERASEADDLVFRRHWYWRWPVKCSTSLRNRS